jgi:pyruvate,water dikinase
LRQKIHDDLCRKERETSEHTIINTPTTVEKQNQFSLNDKEVIQLSQWCYKIENIIKPMDIEWAKDGKQSALYCSGTS